MVSSDRCVAQATGYFVQDLVMFIKGLLVGQTGIVEKVDGEQLTITLSGQIRSSVSIQLFLCLTLTYLLSLRLTSTCMM